MAPQGDFIAAEVQQDLLLEGEEPGESQQTQTQVEFTQQTQDLTPDEFSNQPGNNNQSSPINSPPPPPLPWGRLVPSLGPTGQAPVEFEISKSEYWLGRSTTKCEVPIKVGSGWSKKEKNTMEWAHSMISNRHCRIFYIKEHDDGGKGSGANGHPRPSPDQQQQQAFIEDNSNNGTLINQTTILRRGDRRVLHSGDEICLVNPQTLRKKLSSERSVQAVVQQYSFIFVQSKPRRPCVNPRNMNYTPKQASMLATSPRSARRIEAHYDIREVLGDGTSGQVRRAIHRQSGKEFAVKVISLRKHLDTTSMEHEVSLLQSLDHPYIVQLTDVFLHHGVAMYLVMELVAGGDLFDRIVERKRYGEVDARRVMRRLLSAMHYLHEHCNIVHRDLKPENILCSSPTHVKLADFGLAKMMKTDGLKTFCGTPQYFAPEVLQRRHTVAGEGRYGKPADMWSLGVILYILLTGKPPFGADIDEPQPYVVDFSDDPVWEGMPLAQELVQQMLRLDPKRRLSVRQACDHPWINTEDGDTHAHPLDDPIVTARKRLFAEVSNGDKEPKSNSISMEKDDVMSESNSVASKTDSVLSKEDFAAAANPHRRNDSIFRMHSFPTGAGADDKPKPMADEDDEPRPGDISDKAATETSSVSGNKDNDNDMSDVGEDSRSNTHDSNTMEEEPPATTEADGASPTESTSPAATDGIVAESSVTPSPEADDVTPPRSPLAAMNLNDRTNQFRERVLRQSENDQESNSNAGGTAVAPTPIAPDTSTGDAADEILARTPNASNVSQMKRLRASNPPVETDDADPVLSEFSSQPSSLDSFPDSPQAKKKRPRDRCGTTEPDDHETSSPQSKQRCIDGVTTPSRSTRQTTLSSWFVKKAAEE